MSTRIKVFLFFLIISSSICFRLYNINYDDFWIDEMISFWVANPDYSFSESLKNHRDIEQVPFFFNLITKIYFQIFGYHENIARYLPAVSSILSIFVPKTANIPPSPFGTEFCIALPLAFNILIVL